MKQALEGSTTNYLASRQLAFLGCLQAWRQNDLGRAAGIARLITDDSSKEKQAAQFLLAIASAEKDNVPSKPNLSDTSKWLSDFLIAERYKKNGKMEQANAAYRRSYQAMPQQIDGQEPLLDLLLQDHAKARALEAMGAAQLQESTVADPNEGGLS